MMDRLESISVKLAINRIVWKCSTYEDGSRWCIFCGEKINHRRPHASPHLAKCPLTVIHHVVTWPKTASALVSADIAFMDFLDELKRNTMPNTDAGQMKVTWNYGHRGGFSDVSGITSPYDSIEVWIGDDRIANFAGTTEAMDALALALLDLRTQPEIVKRTKPEKMTEDEINHEIEELVDEISARDKRIMELQVVWRRLRGGE